MKLISIFVIVGCLSAVAFAQDGQYHLLDVSSFNFTAPTAVNTSAASGVPVGAIIYDASTNQFKGLDSSGNWDPMTLPGGAPNITSTGSSNYHVESAAISCTSGGCTIASQSGSWVNGNPSRSSAGVYTITVSAGEWTSAPVCTCGVKDTNSGYLCNPDGSVTNTSIPVIVVNANNSAGSDAGFNILCMGAY